MLRSWIGERWALSKRECLGINLKQGKWEIFIIREK